MITSGNRIYALRHGQSLANQQGLIVSCPRVGCYQYGLTAEGRDQLAARLSDYQAELGPVATLVASDFLRTRETAELAAQVMGCSVRYSRRLRERYFGNWDLTAHENYQRVWEADQKDCEHVHWNVESTRSVWNRVLPLLRRVDRLYRDATIVLVSHGDPIQITASGLAGKPTGQHRSLDPIAPGELRYLAG